MFRAIQSGQVWISSVVLAELYVGTHSRDDQLILDRIILAARRMERLLTPDESDWIRAGRLISRRARLHGSVLPRDHLADVLILVSTARLQGIVVTANLRHFEMWRRLAVAGGLDVMVRAADSTDS